METLKNTVQDPRFFVAINNSLSKLAHNWAPDEKGWSLEGYDANYSTYNSDMVRTQNYRYVCHGHYTKHVMGNRRNKEWKENRKYIVDYHTHKKALHYHEQIHDMYPVWMDWLANHSPWKDSFIYLGQTPLQGHEKLSMAILDTTQGNPLSTAFCLIASRFGRCSVHPVLFQKLLEEGYDMFTIFVTMSCIAHEGGYTHITTSRPEGSFVIAGTSEICPFSPEYGPSVIREIIRTGILPEDAIPNYESNPIWQTFLGSYCENGKTLRGALIRQVAAKAKFGETAWLKPDHIFSVANTVKEWLYD